MEHCWCSLIFTAEVYTVKTAVEELIRSSSPSGSNTIFSLSQSVFLAFRPNARNSTMVTELQQLLYRASVKEMRINFCWVLGYLCIVGNEKADLSVKCTIAGVNGDPQQEKFPPHTHDGNNKGHSRKRMAKVLFINRATEK